MGTRGSGGDGADARVTSGRKDDHIQIVLGEDVRHRTVTTGLERVRFEHRALPELDLAEVDLAVDLLGRRLAAPLVIGAMTGGTARAARINRTLAEAAAARRVGLALGSARVVLEDPSTLATFDVRDLAPDVLLFANLGAVQLRLGVTAADCARLVDRLRADALFLHLNPLQEAIQPEGDTCFAGLAERIAEVVLALAPRPVLVKEVGAGISGPVARRLVEVGVAGIEVAGAGGTSWARIESLRADGELQRRLGETFADWGIPTAECLRAVRAAAPGAVVIGSGGIRDGLEAAKAIALGADAVAAAAPFLEVAEESVDAVVARLDRFVAELRTACFLTGSRTPAALGSAPLVTVP